ncbi:AAA family ATPase [Streptomyces longwoodensis]|uniref:AAA family ATPase n=1 Tax=Streptomyces longwoodensis TaxID=68231 RepID=UPI0033D95A9D
MSGQMITVLTAVVLPLLLSEFGDWCPWLAKRVVRWTARCLGDAAAAERYTEEWLAELEEVPGKLSRLIVAAGKVLALPKSRWELRAQRRAADGRLRMADLLPTRRPQYWGQSDREIIYKWMPQTDALHVLLTAIVDDNLRGGMHMLVGPAGCGKTTVLKLLYDVLQQRGKEVHHLYAPEWVTAWGQRSWPLDGRSRKRLAKASEEVGLLMVDEADWATIRAIETLQLHCPVLLVGRSGDLPRPSVNAGVVMDMTPPERGPLSGLF